MLGFSLEEDESVAVTQKKSSQSRLPGYTISEISKSFKIILPKKIILLTQILMSPYLPYGNERDTFSSSLSQTCGDLHFSQNSQFCDNPNSGRECSAVIRAHAFVVMGKFCLRDRNMARNHVNVFLRELHDPKNGKIVQTIHRFHYFTVFLNGIPELYVSPILHPSSSSYYSFKEMSPSFFSMFSILIFQFATPIQINK